MCFAAEWRGCVVGATTKGDLDEAPQLEVAEGRERARPETMERQALYGKARWWQARSSEGYIWCVARRTHHVERSGSEVGGVVAEGASRACGVHEAARVHVGREAIGCARQCVGEA